VTRKSDRRIPKRQRGARSFRPTALSKSSTARFADRVQQTLLCRVRQLRVQSGSGQRRWKTAAISAPTGPSRIKAVQGSREHAVAAPQRQRHKIAGLLSPSAQGTSGSWHRPECAGMGARPRVMASTLRRTLRYIFAPDPSSCTAPQRTATLTRRDGGVANPISPRYQHVAADAAAGGPPPKHFFFFFWRFFLGRLGPKPQKTQNLFFFGGGGFFPGSDCWAL